MKEKSNIFSQLGLILLLFIAFTALAEFFYPEYVVISYLTKILMLLSFYPLLTFQKSMYTLVWFLFGATVLGIAFVHKQIGYALLIWVMIGYASLFVYSIRFINNILMFSYALCLVQLFGIFFQYFFPDLYKVLVVPMMSFEARERVLNWMDMEMYYCGFTVQPAIIGSFLVVGLGMSIAFVIGKRQVIFKPLTVLFFLALILTSKRSHLLFAVGALVVCYCAVKITWKNIYKVVRVIIAVLILIGLLYYCYKNFEMFSSLERLFDISRLFSSSADELSSGRLTLIMEAWKYFKQSPFVGIGFNVFQTKNVQELAVHNVYMQYLCEGGVFVFLSFILAVIFSFLKTISVLKKAYKNNCDKQIKAIIVLSLYIQTFIYCYCFTGICMFDYIHIYILMLGLLLFRCCEAYVRRQGDYGKDEDRDYDVSSSR